MAMPPRNSYFEWLLNKNKEILAEYGVSVEIKDFNNTIEKLKKLNQDDARAAWELSQELNAWSDYLSDIRSICKKILADLEAEKMAAIATASYAADDKKVANGDRLANKDENVVQARKKRNNIEALCMLLEAKVSFTERAHYACKKTFEMLQNIKD